MSRRPRRPPGHRLCRHHRAGRPEGEILTSEGVAYIVSAIEAVVATLRGVDEDVDSEDPTSSGIVEDLIGKLEQQAWFLSAEVRKPVR